MTAQDSGFASSISLLDQAQGHLAFLEEVNRNATSLEKPHVIANAVRRYENFWLPILRDANEHDILLPPLDVHWAWHVHMLNPNSYASDMTKVFHCNGIIHFGILMSNVYIHYICI